LIRCYLPPNQWQEGKVLLDGREGHHLARVLRVRSGDSVLCFDGTGREADAVVRKVSRQGVLLEAGPTRKLPDPPFSISLAAAVPGQGKLDEIINQATQLGARRIIPLITERTLLRQIPAADRKQERWLQVAVEAAKQSGMVRIPEVQPVQRLDSLLSSFSRYDRVLLASVEGPWEDLRSLLSSGPPREILLLIGPEGDFSPEEVRQAVEAGAARFSLGPTVLRCETACVAALSVVSFLLRGP